ncbi:MAG: hypothetical protein ACI4Q3_00550 [Kiritimatiellia bacterium]
MTEETLQAIEDCGAAEMPLGETLIIAQITEAEWEKNAKARQAYERGQLKTKLAIRQQVIKNAKAGDAKALQQYREYAQINQLVLPD